MGKLRDWILGLSPVASNNTDPVMVHCVNGGESKCVDLASKLDRVGTTMETGSFSYSVNTGGNFPVGEIAVSASNALLNVAAQFTRGTVSILNNDVTVETVGGGLFLKSNAAAPASASATGTVGEVRFDANYIYRCVATNTWRRAALATW